MLNVINKLKSKAPVLLFWSLFAAGLIVKSYAPGLKISHGAFVIPTGLAGEERSLRPDQIVSHERRMQLTSAILASVGALGLAFCYRAVLLPRTVQLANHRPSNPIYGNPGHS